MDKKELINRLEREYIILKDAIIDLKRANLRFDYVEFIKLECLSDGIKELAQNLIEATETKDRI